MSSFNRVFLLGNLTRDPELRYTPRGQAVGDMCIAVNRVWNNEQGQRQEETTFVDITLWGRVAEIAQQFLAKGSRVFIEGRLQLDAWEDKASGQKRSKLKVVGENLQLLGERTASQRESSEQARRPAPLPPQARPPTTSRRWLR